MGVCGGVCRRSYTPTGVILRAKTVPPLPSCGLSSMSYTAIASLVLVVLLLLAALIAFGVGSRRWSWASVAASFLVVLTFGGYLYLATQLLHFEWRWTQAKRATVLELFRTRDALAPSPRPDDRGRLVKIPGEQSIAELNLEKARWERALHRVETWRGTSWDNARFEPPADQAATGTVILAEEPAPAAADEGGEPPAVEAARQPPEAGAIVYLFDTRPIAEGGRYLGGWRVKEVTGPRFTVEPISPPDEDDRTAWLDQSGEVTVYDELPADRWVAFSETPTAAVPAAEAGDNAADADLEEAVAPQPRLDLETLQAEESLTLPDGLREELAEHTLSAADPRRPIPAEEWPALRDRLEAGGLEALPGEYWAEIRFEDQSELEDFLGFTPDPVEGVSPTLSIEVDLESAFAAEAAHNATITTVFRRRRLLDTGMLANGSRVRVGEAADDVVMAEGLATLKRGFERDLAILQESLDRLAAAERSAEAEREIVLAEARALESDLTTFSRDSEAAARLAAAFEAETERAAAQLRETEQAVVDLGRQLNAVVREAVEEIDRIAPPPQARKGVAGPATF